MATTLPTDVGVNYANEVIALNGQLHAVLASVQHLVKLNSDTPLATTFWNNLNTTQTLPDGSLGTPSDPTPNPAHRIDPRVYPALARAVSANDLVSALQILVDFNSFCQGLALTANPARPQQLNAVAM